MTLLQRESQPGKSLGAESFMLTVSHPVPFSKQFCFLPFSCTRWLQEHLVINFQLVNFHLVVYFSESWTCILNQSDHRTEPTLLPAKLQTTSKGCTDHLARTPLKINVYTSHWLMHQALLHIYHLQISTSDYKLVNKLIYSYTEIQTQSTACFTLMSPILKQTIVFNH